MKSKTDLKPPAPTPLRVNTLEELEAMCREIIPVPVQLNGKVVRIPVRRLTPDETVQLDEKLAVVHPPLIKPDGPDGKPVYDFTNPDYLKQIAQTTRLVRSIGLYWTCPLFQQSKPGLQDATAIHEFIMGQLTEGLLETLWGVVTSEGASLEKRVNFTLPPGRTPN